MKKDFKVIILGSDENAYGNARLVYEEYEQKCLLLCGRQLRPTKFSSILEIKVIDNFDKKDVFVATLLQTLKDLSQDYKKICVVPCADYYVDLLVNNYDKFEGLIANKFIPKNLLNSFYRKNDFYNLCEKHSLDFPKTVIANKDERISIIDNLPFDFPIVVKPDNSNSYEYLHSSFVGKKKVYFFNNKQDYLALINNMNESSFDGKLVIQEFIEGDDTTDRVINSYSNSDGKVVVSCLGQPILEEYAPAMLGNYASIISRYEAQVYNMVKNFLESINYVGFSNIDMKYDKKTGRYLAFELNPRLGRSSFFVRSTGTNMMKVLIDDVVFNKTLDLEFVDNTAIWLNVPKKTIKKFVKNTELKNEALDLIKDKRYIKTLIFKEDRNLKRFMLMRQYYELQHSYFNRYYFEKNTLSDV